MTQTMQEQFEQAYLGEMARMMGSGVRKAAQRNLDHKRPDGTYNDPMLRLALWAWEASRQTLVAGAPCA